MIGERGFIMMGFGNKKLGRQQRDKCLEVTA